MTESIEQGRVAPFDNQSTKRKMQDIQARNLR